jgi:hypothetical protein
MIHRTENRSSTTHSLVDLQQVNACVLQQEANPYEEYRPSKGTQKPP